jgi:hypothetical protein
VTRFDFVDPARTGAWARLADEAGHELTITDWPTSLIQMLLGGFLSGTAKSTAEALRDGLAPDVLARLERGAAANFAAANRLVIEKSAQGAPEPRPKLRAILASAVSFDDAVTRDDPEPEDQQPEWLKDARAVLGIKEN